MTAYSSATCADTACRSVDVLMGPTVYVPNTFTPDGNGVNETFGPSVLGITGYHFWIFDRWGRPLFESSGRPSFTRQGERSLR